MSKNLRKIIIGPQNCFYPLPDGTKVQIPKGAYRDEDHVRKAVNKALKAAGKPFRFAANGDISPVRSVDGELPEVPVNMPGLVEGIFSRVPDFLRKPVQIWCAMQMIVSYCEKAQDIQGWLVGRKMYDKFIADVNPKGWPQTFREFVTANFPDFTIPETAKSGLVIAGTEEMLKEQSKVANPGGEER